MRYYDRYIESDEFLAHKAGWTKKNHKYISREKKGNKWRYTYEKVKTKAKEKFDDSYPGSVKRDLDSMSSKEEKKEFIKYVLKSNAEDALEAIVLPVLDLPYKVIDATMSLEKTLNKLNNSLSYTLHNTLEEPLKEKK